MGKVLVKVDAGVCGCSAKISADSKDGQTVQIIFETDCPNLKKFEPILTEVDGFSACFGHPCDSYIYKLLGEHIPHSACPVPSAIIKACEAACGFALCKDAHIEVLKLEEK